MDEIQKVLIKAGHKDLAAEYYKKIAGRWQPDIKSMKRTSIVLDKNDFKDKNFFNGLLDDLGLSDAFHKKVRNFDSGGEPDPSIDFYDQITIFVSKSSM